MYSGKIVSCSTVVFFPNDFVKKEKKSSEEKQTVSGGSATLSNLPRKTGVGGKEE
jgi:hypothetical protein